MLGQLFQGNTVPLLETVVNFSQARHNMLAGNIANIDTPGYRGMDLDTTGFTQQLREMVEAQKQGFATSETHDFSELKHRSLDKSELGWGSLVRHDDGDVNLEQQVAQLSKNYMQHNLALTIMNSQFRLLQAAVSEKV
jgi:flagellar basal-body rod protein FlgB